MANALAIAAVTATLKDLLNDGVYNSELDALGDVNVTSQPPDTLVTDAPRNALNIYPWMVSHNAALSNHDLPAYRGTGQRASRNRLALDIHYILTATGEEDLNAPILMGFGMHQLHENPILTRDAIRRTLGTATPPVENTLLPADYRMLVASDLAEQMESVRLVPAMNEDEELTKIWPAFNAALRLSALYRVSVVLIEADKQPQPTLPVRTLGLSVDPMLRPRIVAVHHQTGDRDSPAEPQPVPMGGRLLLLGSGLASDHVRVKVGSVVLEPVEDPMDPTTDSVASDRISIRLPSATGAAAIAMEAGVKTAIVEHRFPPVGSDQRVRETSSPAAVIISPVIDTISSTASGDPDTGFFSGHVDVELTHEVGVRQSVRLLLNPAPGSGLADSFSVEAAARPPKASAVRFALGSIPGGTYMYRVEIDGAPTALTTNAADAYNGPTITLAGAP